MRAAVAITRTTLRQLLGGKRLIALGLLALLPATVMVLITRTSTPGHAFQVFHGPPLAILFLVLLPIVSLVFGASALGDERRDQTLSFLLLRPIARATLAGSKLLAAWIASFLLVGAGAAASSIILGLRSGDWSPLGPMLLAAAVATLAYTSVFLVLGYLTGRAVLIGLAYVFIWESGITMGVASLATVSLFRVGLTAYLGLEPKAIPDMSEVLGTATPGAGGAVLKVLVIGVLAVLATAALLRRRDVT
jgi:ABC-2 type transport system permease protein